jgi:hypothetical protein
MSNNCYLCKELSGFMYMSCMTELCDQISLYFSPYSLRYQELELNQNTLLVKKYDLYNVAFLCDFYQSCVAHSLR